MIIAREKFLFTSSVEILQSLLKLAVIVSFLVDYGGNRLRLYAIIMAFAQLIQPVTYTVYCLIKEKRVTRWAFNSHWNDYKEIIVFNNYIIFHYVDI